MFDFQITENHPVVLLAVLPAVLAAICLAAILAAIPTIWGWRSKKLHKTPNYETRGTCAQALARTL